MDRVDLVFFARDNIEEIGGDSTVFQTLIVRIVDINDNPRKFVTIVSKGFQIHALMTFQLSGKTSQMAKCHDRS